MASRRAPAHGFSRSDRVAEQIRRELADLVRFHLKDQRIAAKMALVTISAVEVTPDYAHAKVFYTSLADSAQSAELAQAFARSASYLRRELGKRVRIHHVPELHFVFDSSVEEGARLSKLIDEAIESDQRREDD